MALTRGRKFILARDLLRDLLDRHEAGVQQPVGYPDYAGFPDVTSADVFDRAIREAERSGAIELSFGKGHRRDELKLVRLIEPGRLYAYLGRIPSVQTAAAKGDDMLAGLDIHPDLRREALSAVDAWSRNRKWGHIGIDNAGSLRNAVILAQAIVDRLHLDMDYRTFSRRMVGDSKALERLEAIVLRLVGAVIDVPDSGNPRAVFATLGLERFSPPLLLSGRFLLGGNVVSRPLSYLGIPPNAIGQIGFTDCPDYVLTIENFASFNRHVLEADTQGRGLTLYIGGYPSLAAQAALAELSARLPETVPFFHWSDIDPDGTWIFRTIEKALGRRLRPHLMSVELAKAHGRPRDRVTKLRAGEAAGTLIADLVDYLCETDAQTMEQEHIDPQFPDLYAVHEPVSLPGSNGCISPR